MGFKHMGYTMLSSAENGTYGPFLAHSDLLRLHLSLIHVFFVFPLCKHTYRLTGMPMFDFQKCSDNKLRSRGTKMKANSLLLDITVSHNMEFLKKTSVENEALS